MRRRFTGRVLAVLLFSVAIGWSLARDEAKWHTAGKAAFLQHESYRFDRFMTGTPTVARAIGFSTFLAAGFGLYEAVAFAFTRFLNSPAASNRT